MNKVIIIGGGASGLMAAYSASMQDCEVIILEKNGECGKKLCICGKGRGNITNTAELKDFIEAFGKNGNFLYSAFSQFFNYDLLNFFETNGLRTVEERGGRVFPITEKASDVKNLLVELKKKNNVKIKYGTKAEEIIADNNVVTGVKIHEGIIKCDKVVLATGGLSYPKTGSTGDGYKIAVKLGHTLTELKPSICPILSPEKWIQEIAGLSLKNVEVSLINKNTEKSIFTQFGEMLFTHKGVSGPIILTLSKYLADQNNIKNFYLSLDLKPAINEDELRERLTNDFKSNVSIKNYFRKILPSSLASIFYSL
ncbi:MAG: aminoacetone oxidase family FAD-binding enzyme, partial [Armatimonadetes bacterium]|nr:aminoacetone oxidase family FAD-binding enzyme [Candidatus Hippobium faecium]